MIQSPFGSGHAKDTLYEGGVRVALLIAGPDIVAPDRESAALVNAVDIYSTILELAGIDVAATQPATRPIDAVSLLPVLRNQNDPVRHGYADQSGSSLGAAESRKTVVNAAGYKFGDFVRVGLPLAVLLWISLTTLLVWFYDL